MKIKEITLTISGEPKIGKSHLTMLLKKLLRDKGFEIEFKGTLDYPSETNLNEELKDSFKKVIKSIKKECKIIIKDGV